jgi:hypothetical protein
LVIGSGFDWKAVGIENFPVVLSDELRWWWWWWFSLAEEFGRDVGLTRGSEE